LVLARPKEGKGRGQRLRLQLELLQLRLQARFEGGVAGSCGPEKLLQGGLQLLVHLVQLLSGVHHDGW
jgi:hypothetical protein